MLAGERARGTWHGLRSWRTSLLLVFAGHADPTDGRHLMRILADRWTDGFLDEALVAGSCRVEPQLWLNVRRVEGMHFIRSPGLRILWNYWREIGTRDVVLKVASRRRERVRNERWLSCGFGRVLATDQPDVLEAGTQVVFIAPSHPRCMERVVLPVALMRPTSMVLPRLQGRLLHVADAEIAHDAMRSLEGWTGYSGVELDSKVLEQALNTVEAACGVVNAATGRHLRTGTPVTERSAPPESTRPVPIGGPTACLIGYGNYAKTMILPNVRPRLTVRHVHEIDPTQIGPRPNPAFTWDTAPILRPACDPDVVLVAGYHHTHAPAAAAALDRGISVMVEKPLATSFDQLDRLLQAMDRSTGRVFACFQRRYLPFGGFIRADLGVGPTDPVDYHCIVYEEPLPALHWYRWPTSRSRLTSNGCHWIDHFLFLNGFVGVLDGRTIVAGGGVVMVRLELVNGAVFTMTLTERGSARTGLQDYIELRSARGTVRIANSMRYTAERDNRVVRRLRCRRLEAHAAMYRSIADAVRRGDAGDSRRSVEMTARQVLRLEERLSVGD